MNFHVAAVALAFAVPHGIGAGYPGIPYHYTGHVPADVRFLARVEASVQAGFEGASTYRLRSCSEAGKRRWTCEARLFFIDDSATVERCRMPITVRLRGRLYRSTSGWVYAACELIPRGDLTRLHRTRPRGYDGTAK